MGGASNLVKNATFGLVDTENEAGATAAGNAAAARERALKKGVGFAETGLEDARAFGAAGIEAAKSPQELQALTQSLNQQGAALDRQSQLFQSLDPAIMEASNQALKLLQGEEAKSLGPLKKNRETQRQKLLARLREQLGPGAETSTAGIQALNQFDQETSTILGGAQQQGLSQLFGIAEGGAQGRSALNQGAQGLASIASGFGNNAARQSQAQFNAGGLTQAGTSGLVSAQQGFSQGAGSQFVANQLKANANNQFVNDRIQAGEQIAASFAGGAGGAAGCFPAGTMFKMADGTEKAIQDIDLDDEMFIGGKVIGTLRGRAKGAEWYKYKGTTVTGTHAVKHEGTWMRVADVKEAQFLDIRHPYLYNLINENHQMICGDVIFSDMAEVDQYELNYTDSLKAKNAIITQGLYAG